MITSVLVTIFLGFIIPVYSFYILYYLGKFKLDDAAAVAAHYGSISVVIFFAAVSFLENSVIAFEGYVAGLPAVMEKCRQLSLLF